MERFLIVVAAGGLGSGVRYLVGRWTGDGPGDFPLGTLIVNLVGSFLIALVLELALRMKAFPPNLALALATGFMGGFTTYSAFNYQTTTLALEGAWARASLNLLVTIVGCLLAGLAGLWLARRFV